MAAALIPESALSDIVGKLVNTASSYVQQDEASGGMAGEVAGLQQALPKMELILMALEGTQIADRHKEVETWLWRLRDAVEGAEDVLDELDYYELEKKIQARDRHKVSVPVSRRKRKYTDFVKRIFSDDTLKSLMEAVKELNEVAAGMQRIIQIVADSYGGSGFNLQSRYDVTKARETRSCLIENVVLGRDKERDWIVEWLTKQVDHQQPSSSDITNIPTFSSDITNIPTFAIVGESRAGKTALAQLIYCDERVRGYFDMVMWVTVSENFSALLRKLKSKLISKRFLLILDDIESTSAEEWNHFIFFDLNYSGRGSKILLTTEIFFFSRTTDNTLTEAIRRRGIGSQKNTFMDAFRRRGIGSQKNTFMDAIRRRGIGSQTEVLNLKDLEESDYMMLFNKHAYPCVDPDEHEDLKLIGKQIASKLRGMPSPARVVGRVLSSRMDYGYWERILNYIMNLEQSEGGLTVLSEWDHLPTHLQMCFRYCSLFPQGYMFEKDKLISMWMASGLIQQPMDEQKRPEDIGADYLNILSRKSFFNRKLRGPGENFVYYYFMHDLLYELAQNTSSGECLQIKGVGQKNIPSTLRHLTLENATPLEIRMISHLKHLRTLIVSYTDFCNPEGDHVCALNEVLKGLKSLRLFSLNVYIFRKLPDPIGSLIHLRYLSLQQQCSNKNLLDFCSHPVYGPSFRRVLDWFAQSAHRLYHLEVMETSEFSEVNFDKTELDGLDNLINLRHLYFPSDITIRIPWIGKLTSLQELNDFNVREESGYRITELKDLKELRQLYVGNLQNASHEEAVEAKLKTKANLKSLTLEWSVGRSTVSETDELFLDNLQPYCNLTELKLDGYNGASFSNWINSEFLPNLKSVVLFNCHKLENLPLVLLNSLHFLHLNSMRAVKTICLSMYGCNAPVLQLRELRFECMPEWVEWDLVEGRSSFPELQILEIKDCPRLRRLPTLPRNLRGLSITNAGSDYFPRIHSFVDPKEVGLSSPPVAHPFPVSDYSSITNAGLDDFPRSYPRFGIFDGSVLSSTSRQVRKVVQGQLPRQRKKQIFQYFDHQERSYHGKHQFKQYNPSQMTQMIQGNIVLPTLERLAIGRCGQFDVSVLGSLSSLTSLSRLRMDGCVNVSFLPSARVFEQLTALRSLEILNCKNLESLGGIQALRSLRFLSICGCGKLTADSSLHPPTVIDVNQGDTTAGSSLNLDELEIDHHLLLLVEPLKSLVSAKRLVVTNASSLACFPENWLLRNRTSLQDITMYDAVCLHSLPPSMASFCSLQTLKLFHAPLIESLPILPTLLTTLCITDCHPLLKERCQEGIGLDWCKIANIPHVSILKRFHADDN